MTVTPNDNVPNITTIRKTRRNLVAGTLILIVVLLAGVAGIFYNGIQTDKKRFAEFCGKYVSAINSSFTDYSISTNKPSINLWASDPSASLRSLKQSVSAYETFLKNNSRYSGSKESTQKLNEFQKKLAGFINAHNRLLSKELSNPNYTELNVLARMFTANLYRYSLDLNDTTMKKIEKMLLQTDDRFDRYMQQVFDPTRGKSENEAVKAKAPLSALCSASKK